MSDSKTNFLKRISTFQRTLSSDFLRDKGLVASLHNEKARILRNGISIIGFTILEDFIKDRTGEALQKIGDSSVSFGHLTAEIQEAVTIMALRSILEKANNLKRSNEDWLTFIQNEVHHVASTASAPFSISKFSLGWEKSNLAKDDIPKFLKVFNIVGGWNTIQQVTTLAGSTLLLPDTFFLNAANRRHIAAHNPNANSLYMDLVDFCRDVKSFAFAYDALLSKGLHHVITNNIIRLNHTHIIIRFLIKDNGSWKEYRTLPGRAIKSDKNFNRILAVAKRRARANNAILLVKNSAGDISNWFA